MRRTPHSLIWVVALVSLLTGGVCVGQTPPIFNVKNYGATGDGVTIDTPAINDAIAAASAGGGGTVTFPPGNYASVSIHLSNNVTLYLSNNAVILCGSTTEMDLPEPNPWDNYQDYGHSHFHNALIWGESLTNIGFAGPGTINGNAKLYSSDTPPAGQADKAISLKRCANVVIAGITITRAGHFAILANGCQHFTMTNTTILNATLSNHRDAINLINSSHAYIANCQIEGSDDAMCLKADFALGQKFTNTDIVVENCTIRSTQNNATQFGSETVGDFYNVRFSNLNLIEAGKAGIGLTSNDGSVIDGVTYDNITMTNCACPIHIKLSNQNRPSSDPHPVGRIRNISLNNVTARHSVSINTGITARTNTPTIAGYGENGQTPIPIENIVLRNVDISTIGGLAASNSYIVPAETQNWTPNSFGLNGVRPAYGWYVRHAKNISFINCRVRTDIPDGRPALIADDVNGIKLDGFVADVNTAGPNASPYDLAYTNVTAFDIAAATGTSGAALRIISSLATSNAIVAPPLFAPSSGGYTNAQAVTLATATAGANIRFTTDGSTPTASSGTLYSGAVNVTNSTVLKAIAYAGSKTNSAVNTAIYSFNAAVVSPPVNTPFFDPPGDIYAGAQTVVIASGTEGVMFRYTTDGSVPATNSGTVYSGPVPVDSSLTLKAIAYTTNLLASAVASASYVITHAAAAPVFTPPGGTYTNAQTVSMDSDTSDATIRYTVDGSTPTSTSGAIYSDPITISSNTTVKAMAYASGAGDSAVASATYAIILPPPSFVFEAEALSYVTNGAVAILQNDANNSGGHWLAFEATGAGQFIDYTIPNIPAGTYNVKMSWKGNTQRGISSFALGGTVLGGSLDQYSSSQTYPTTDYGIVTLTNTGSHVIRLASLGKNPSANGYWISTDQFIFIQLQAGPPQSPHIGAVVNGGASLMFTGDTGIPTANYFVLASTNLGLPLANWTPVATNVFDAGGGFGFVAPLNAGGPKQFYVIKCPLLEVP